ncbi:14509_t:CDS:1 [Funneliformis geosporum]|nr:14509_t:CDS:1 [Funneliformis geosporum]
MLKLWLEPRIKPNFKNDSNGEKPWLDIIEDMLKDICIRVLSPLPLDVFAHIMDRLVRIYDEDRVFILERLLTITPHPDEVTGEVTIRRMRSYLISTLSPSDTVKDPLRIEISEDFVEMAKMVLERSHQELADTDKAITEFYMNHIHRHGR